MKTINYVIAILLAATVSFAAAPTETFYQYAVSKSASNKADLGKLKLLGVQNGLIVQHGYSSGMLDKQAVHKTDILNAINSDENQLNNLNTVNVQNGQIVLRPYSSTSIVKDVISKGPNIDVRAFMSFVQRMDVFFHLGLVDVTSSIQSAINTASANTGATVILPDGKYLTNGSLYVSSNNIVFKGLGKATITTSNPVILTFTSDVSNVTFDNITFESTSSSTGGVLGLITAVGVNLSNINFYNDTFTCNTAETNAIKIDVGAGSLDKLDIHNCTFYNNGRMGVEVINHNFDGVFRYKNIKITNNKFLNLGTASIYGQAVSLSGLGNNVIVANNNIEAAKDIAIENVGASNIVITSNTIHDLVANCISISVGWANSTYLPNNVNITNNTMQNLTGGFFQPTRIINGVIANNIITNSSHKISMQILNGVSITGNNFNVSQQIYLSALTGCSISGNTFHTITSIGGYYPYMIDCVNNSIGANNWISENIFALDIAGASIGNNITGGLFDNTACATNAQTLRIEGTSSNNAVTGVKINKGTGGTYYGQYGSATGNNFYTIDCGGVVTLTNGNITIGSANAGLATSNSTDIKLIDGAGNSAIRSLRANAWSDSQNSNFIQLGNTNDKSVLTGGSASVLSRLFISAATTQVGGQNYTTIPNPGGSPVNNFEVYDPSNNRNFAITQYGLLYNRVGSVVASASSINPLSPLFHVSGTATINTIVVPYTGFAGCIKIIPDGVWSTNITGNIALASTAVVNKKIEFCYDGSLWYPSY
jgi:hypothetical protein